MNAGFELHAPFQPTGDQPHAIAALVAGARSGQREQTLLGVTGSGKTFTMANCIAQLQQPTLVISHNKTLAAQLASEFREFFPNSAVHYFVSFYDYYQPESYIPRTDTYIEKTTALNEEIERLRHAATQALLSRRDVIIVASVSCIYGLGSPVVYKSFSTTVTVGQTHPRRQLLQQLVDMQYERNELAFTRGTFRVKGEVVEIFPAMADRLAIRVRTFGDTIERIEEFNVLNNEVVRTLEAIDIYPATHYVAPLENRAAVFAEIEHDGAQEVAALKAAGRPLEAYRLEQRTNHDLEMLRQTGYVNGIENYSRYFDRRAIGEPPYTLLEYFPKEYFMIIDESHMTLPQIGGMYKGDRARKQTLVEYGFRLKAALDNRPLRFEEFNSRINQVVYVSATPGKYELERSAVVAEQLIRPTGLLDPVIEVRPTPHQIDDVLTEIGRRVKKQQRVLVTTLTKRMAEELTDYLQERGIAVQYLHSEVDTMERLEILRDLRLGVYDVLVGINLLREGLDLPEVSLVIILDADKEGFLRSTTALIQTIGRAARHDEGRVLMYADRLTDAMKTALAETERRRTTQHRYNSEHSITPKRIEKIVRDDRLSGQKLPADETAENITAVARAAAQRQDGRVDIQWYVTELDQQMQLAAAELRFEDAARLRDEIKQLKTYLKG